MTSEDASSTKTSTRRRKRTSEALLIAALISSGALVYELYFDLESPRRVVLALVSVGFFFAPVSGHPLRPWAFALGVAVVGWAGQLAASGNLIWSLWMLSSAAGAYLVVRGGSRAATVYLPAAGTEDGERQRARVRRNLNACVVLFLIVFVSDGEAALPAVLRAGILFAAATLFMRFFLLQSKFLKLAPPSLDARGIVPQQRVPVLLLMALCATPWANRLLAGGDVGPLLVSAMLVLVLAGLLSVLALVHLGWPRPTVRKASFVMGMGLAVTLAAALVELEAWGTYRFTIFSTACTAVVVVGPFARQTTRLFAASPRLAALLPGPLVAVMLLPVAAFNGIRWSLPSAGFLFAFAVLVHLHHLVVAARERRAGAGYLAASLSVVTGIFISEQVGWSAHGSAWKMFILSLCFLLAAVDLLDRAHRVAEPSPP